MTPPATSALPSNAPPATAPSPWIYRPWVDLLVGCGAWSAPLLLLAWVVAKAHTDSWSLAFYLLALLFNYPHFMATVYRAYHKRSEFAKYRTFTVHIALLLAVAGLAAHLWYPVLPWIFTLYICWSPWHYTGQNFGLLMLLARRSGISPSEAERRALRWSFIASYVLLMLSFHTGASDDALILSLGLPAKFTVPAEWALAVFFLLASGWALLSMARRSGVRHIAAPLTLASTQFFWFLLPVAIVLATGQGVPQTRYSSGILAVLHSTQYLWITSYYQEREARAAGDSGWKLSRYLLTLVAGGIALFIPGPWIASRLFHADFAASFLTFMALVNIHHFLLDGAIWKLRDSKVASLLIKPGEKTREIKPESRGLGRAASWLAGKSAGARAIQIGAAAALFLWAGMDQYHFYLSSEKASVPALRLAARLNPEDSAVQVRLAKAEMQLGRKDAAVEAFGRAAAVNPTNLPLQEEYAKGLIEAGRTNDAYGQYQQILRRSPKDVNALVNLGLLAHQLGHDDEAQDYWQEAIAVAPAESSAQLYLAQLQDQVGEAQAAARHYRAYLQIVAAHPDDHIEERTTVVAALIKVADADAASSHTKDATNGYLSAVRFAQTSGSKDLEALAMAHLADFQEKQQMIAAAAESYQKALQVDAELSASRGAAVDWFNYGQFLRRHGQPRDLVIACLLEAQKHATGSSKEEQEAIVTALAEVKREKGPGEGLRHDQEALARQALALPGSAFRAGN